MRRDNQSEIVRCQNAKLGRVMVFVDENVILKNVPSGPMFGDDDRDFALYEQMILW